MFKGEGKAVQWAAVVTERPNVRSPGTGSPNSTPGHISASFLLHRPCPLRPTSPDFWTSGASPITALIATGLNQPTPQATPVQPLQGVSKSLHPQHQDHTLTLLSRSQSLTLSEFPSKKVLPAMGLDPQNMTGTGPAPISIALCTQHRGPDQLHPTRRWAPAAYLLRKGACNAPASREKQPVSHSTEAQAAREGARDSLSAILLHNQQRKRKMPEIASFISPPDNSWSSIGCRPSAPAPHPVPIR